MEIAGQCPPFAHTAASVTIRQFFHPCGGAGCSFADAAAAIVCFDRDVVYAGAGEDEIEECAPAGPGSNSRYRIRRRESTSPRFSVAGRIGVRPLADVFRGILPFSCADVATVALFRVFPEPITRRPKYLGMGAG